MNTRSSSGCAADEGLPDGDTEGEAEGDEESLNAPLQYKYPTAEAQTMIANNTIATYLMLILINSRYYQSVIS